MFTLISVFPGCFTDVSGVFILLFSYMLHKLGPFHLSGYPEALNSFLGTDVELWCVETSQTVVFAVYGSPHELYVPSVSGLPSASSIFDLVT